MNRLLLALALASSMALTHAAETETPGGVKMVPLKLELPKPLFVGTPSKLKTDNLEKAPGDRAKFLVPEGTTNVALKKAATASDKEPFIGKIEQITDGIKDATDDSYVEFWKGLQWIQIDLENPTNIYAIVVWHFHSEPRVYKDVVVQVADDADFKTNVRTVFNNDHDNSAALGSGKDFEYVDNADGKLMDGKGVKARYVRCYSQGSTASDQNHYIEVEVHGIPAK